jgi:hypothetical protein
MDVRRSVECSHVFGLMLQRSKLPALMKSADRLPDHVNALEALCPPGFHQSRSLSLSSKDGDPHFGAQNN